MRFEGDGSRTRYRYAKESGCEIITVDVIGDGAELVVLLPEGKRRISLSAARSVDELIREAAAGLLVGWSLASVEDETLEIDAAVAREMERTPISLKDDRYEKRSLDALVLCLDLRRFSSFARDAGKDAVIGFLEKYSQELLAAATGSGVSYYKLLGDGALLVWDEPVEADYEAAVGLFHILRQVVAEIGPGFGYKRNIAGALSVDEVYKYEINAESSGLKYRDYLGYAVNSVFRLQEMAAPGELLAGSGLARRFSLDLPRLDPDRKPPRTSLEGLRDEDYDEVFVLVPAQ